MASSLRASSICGRPANARLGQVAGGLSVALARTFTIPEPGLKNPQSAHWERAFQIFDLLL